MKQILNKTWPGAHAGEWIDNPAGEEIASYNPFNGSELGRVRLAGDQRPFLHFATVGKTKADAEMMAQYFPDMRKVYGDQFGTVWSTTQQARSAHTRHVD